MKKASKTALKLDLEQKPMTARQLLAFILEATAHGNGSEVLDAPVAMMSDAEGNRSNILSCAVVDRSNRRYLKLWPM